MNGNNRGGFRPRSGGYSGGDNDSFRRNSFSPVKVGEELDVKIEAVGEKGDGVAKVKGFVLFVPGVKAGDEVKIKVTKVLKNVGFAEVVGKSEPKAESTEEATEESSTEEASEETEETTDEEEKKPNDGSDSDDFGASESEETDDAAEEDYDEFQGEEEQKEE